ncbi:hypothetical protein MKQ70_33380 [Chitinophaga sedimenti]|uniref:hypothetical protein n=1 Tax=Chitinophaga sedimenti TaxID=2033606 RepID=UPI0020058F51|nr:hypothetical protein [Chitinophaga sedimenti]MCK7559581.1 hypothetical protein [Chitinophaga sedimenti]
MQKRWTVKKYQPGPERSLQAALRIHPLLCRLLVQRGILTFDAAKHFSALPSKIFSTPG